MDQVSYPMLQITGPVSIERVDQRDEHGHNVLIMGPTGAGKSTFIEALGLQGEKISSGNLEGFTQTLTAYTLVNATYQDSKLYIVDSPGFADPKISELTILSMVKKWLEEKEGTYFSHILFLTPITHIRLSGSRRQVLRAFQAITGIATAQNVVIVTTMWDSLGSETAKQRSESTFKQLQEEAWKDFTEKGSRVLKFHNTQESALSILNEALGWPMRQFFVLEDMVRESQGLEQSSFAQDLQNDLQDRILALGLQRDNVLSELEAIVDLESEMDKEEMRGILVPKLEGIEEDIARFTQELEDFGTPPVPSPEHFDSNHDIQTPISKEGYTEKIQQDDAIICPPTMSPIPETSPVVASYPPPISTATQQNSIPQLKQRKGKIARLIHSIKCWGKAVLERHDA